MSGEEVWIQKTRINLKKFHKHVPPLQSRSERSAKRKEHLAQPEVICFDDEPEIIAAEKKPEKQNSEPEIILLDDESEICTASGQKERKGTSPMPSTSKEITSGGNQTTNKLPTLSLHRIQDHARMSITENPKIVNPPEPAPKVIFTERKHRWLSIPREKSDLRRTQGVYAVKRSRNDALVKEIFTYGNVKPTKRPCLPSKGKGNAPSKGKVVPTTQWSTAGTREYWTTARWRRESESGKVPSLVTNPRLAPLRYLAIQGEKRSTESRNKQQRRLQASTSPY